MGFDTSPQKEGEIRLEYIQRLLDRFDKPHNPQLPLGAPDRELVDRSLRRQAQNVVAGATLRPEDDPRVIGAFKEISESGLNAFYGERGREITNVMYLHPDAAKAIRILYSNALGEATQSPREAVTQGVLEGMSRAAEAIQRRPAHEHPACYHEDLGNLVPDDGSCVLQQEAKRGR